MLNIPARQSGLKGDCSTAIIRLSNDLKITYLEIIPVLSGRGKKCTLTLMGRRRENPAQLEEILSQPWKQGDPVEIAWLPQPSHA
jgi:hypothetical protein